MVPVGRTPLIFVLVVAAIALGWRLVDISDWPSEYPTIQYESALASRTILLSASSQRTAEQDAWLKRTGNQYITSPPILPGLVAAVSVITGEETPWVSRFFTIGFWLAAGGFVNAAAVRFTHSRWAGAVAFAFFVLVPFGMVMSRCFQTEALLVLGLALSMWQLAVKLDRLTLRQTLLTGLVCGAASFIKPGMLFAPLILGFAVVVFPRSVPGTILLKLFHVSLYLVLIVVPGTLYALLLLRHHTGRIQPHLLGEAWFYEGVIHNIWWVVGTAGLVALIGIGMAARSRVYLPAAILIGHLGTLAIFTFHAATHTYYQTPLLVLTAVALAWPVAALERSRFSWNRSRSFRIAWTVTLTTILALYLVATRKSDLGPWRYAPERRARLDVTAARHNDQIEKAKIIREVVGVESPIIELTDVYGYPLMFYAGLEVLKWPSLDDQFYNAQVVGGNATLFSAEETLRQMNPDGHWKFFVITDLEEWNLQPKLQAALRRYGPPREPGVGVLIFDLRGR